MANPYKICGGNAAAGSATLVVTVTTGTTAGDAIAVWVATNNNNISGVSDSKSNSYVQKGSTTLNGTIAGAWFVALPENNSGTTAALVASTDTITFTCSSTGGSKDLSAFGMTGVVTSTATDVAPAATTGTSTSPSITSGALAQAAEYVLAGEQHANAGSTITWGSPFSGGVTDSQHNGAAEFANSSVLLVSSTASVTASGTITSAAWGMSLFSLKISAPSITTTSPLPGGTTGASYTTTLAESGGAPAFTWSVTGGSLSGSGLSLSSAGVLSGTAATAGTYTFTAQVQDAAGQTATKSLSVTITNNLAFVTSSPLPAGTQGVSYSQTITTSGGNGADTQAVTGGSLSGSGLSLSSGGVLSGTAGTPGTYTFTDTVTDSSSNTASKSYSVTINAATTFPSSILDLKADLLINGTWTSVTPNVYSERVKPNITRGRPDGSSQANPSTATFQLNNTTANFNPLNPLGTYYGNIGRNTPFRFHVPEPTAYARFEDDNVSLWSCPTSAGLNLSTVLEARIDLLLTSFHPSVLCGKWANTSGNFGWALLLNANGTLSFLLSSDGSTITTITSTQPLPTSISSARFSIKVTFSSSTVTFYYATSIGGAYTQLGSAVSTGMVGSIFASNSAVKVGNATYFNTIVGFSSQNAFTVASQPWVPAAYQGMNGKVYEFQLRSVIGGTLVADPVFSSQSNGATSFTDSQSNSWTATGTTTVSNRKFRFHGEMSDWPQRWDVTGTDVYVDVTANGLLRRAQVGNNPLDSALTRAWQQKTGKYAPLAYWPVEDPTNATQIANGITGVRPMTVSQGTAQFASNSSFPSSNPIAVPLKSTWTGYVPPYTVSATPAVVVRFLLSVPSAGESNGLILARLFCTGTVRQLDLIYGTGGTLNLTGYDTNGGTVFTSGNVAFNCNGLSQIVEMALTDPGTGTVTWHINTLVLNAAQQTGLSNTYSGSVDKGHIIIISPTNSTMNSACGQITFQSAYANFGMDSATSADSLIGPLNAWNGEAAGLRFARLCNEEGFSYRVVGYPQTSVQLGTQAPSTLQQLLQECEDADHGMVFEPRQALALGYNTSASMCNQTASVSHSYTSAQLGGAGGMSIQPQMDDKLTVNDGIASRSSSGSSYEIEMSGSAYAASSALSTNNPPSGVGVYQNQSTVNVWDDKQLGDQAGWMVHLGTVNEYRYPVIPVDFSRSEVSSIYNTLQDIDLGDFITITSPPAWLGYDNIKCIVWGINETLGGYIYNDQFNTTPESPYEVLVAGTGATSDNRADTDASSVHANITNIATSMQVDTTSGGVLWTTTAGDFPFDIIVGGERMTVTNITGSTSPQTFTVTRSVNGVVKAQTSGTSVNLFQPVYLALV